ncbi:hypothetical protein ACHAWT_010727 [Skeletonema menzelii]
MGSADLNHYQLFGVEQNATADEIRTAYKKMSVALHPDKNRFGINLMKSVNAAWATLSDDTERRKYDREITMGGGRTTNRYSQYDDCDYEYYEARISRLEQQLRSSTSQNQELRYQLNDKNKALADARASSKSLGKKLKHLEGKHKQSETQCKQLNQSVHYYKSENNGLQKSLNNAHDENGDLRDKLDLYEKEKKKAVDTLKKEKQQFEDILAAEREKATEQIEQMKKEMIARSICYTCNGEGGNDCITCKGQGSVQGKWTRCHNCKGTGTLTSLHGKGKEVECLACFGRGAKEGVFQIPCFKCKGDRKKKINCSTCHKGKVRGFSLKPCPFCEEGNDCMNCLGEGRVLFGYLCNRNKVAPSPSSLQTALKKEDDKGDDWLDRFMESANSNYKSYTNEWEKCRAFVSLTDYEDNEDLKPSAGVDVDEAKDTFAKFIIESRQVSFSIGLSKGGRPMSGELGRSYRIGVENRKGKKKQRASGQKKPSASSPTSVLFSSNVKADTCLVEAKEF